MSNSRASSPQVEALDKWTGLFLALIICAPLYIFFTFNHDLWRPAEAREAAIAREMIETGNWVATSLNGRLFLEKPPLYTWTLAASLKLFGYHDWAVRVPVLLFTLGTLTATYFLARFYTGWFGSIASVAALATMFLFNEVNHGAMIDNGLVFLISLAMLAFVHSWLEWQHGRDSRVGSELPGLPPDRKATRPTGLWRTVFYLCVGAAFLCKGAIGPGLILVPCFGFVVYAGRWRFARFMHPVPGFALSAIVAGAWILALWLKGGREYFHVFFIYNHLERLTGSAGPSQPFYYYVKYIFLTPLPWTILLLPALHGLAIRLKDSSPSARTIWVFLFWWTGAMFVTLSAAGSKDNQYILPLLPAIALVFGAFLEQTTTMDLMPRWWSGFIWMFVTICALGIALLPLVKCFATTPAYVLPVLAMIVLALPGYLAVRRLARGDYQGAWTRMSLLVVGAGLALGAFVEPVVNEAKTSRPAWEFVNNTIPADALFLGYDLDENTQGFLYFYGRGPRRVKTIEEAVSIAAGKTPSFMLLVSRGPSCPMAEQLHNTGWWFPVASRETNGRKYWILGNPEARKIRKISDGRGTDKSVDLRGSI